MKYIIVGKKYGRLTVLENHHPKDEVVCRCECGNIKIARATNVYYGGTRSCGCLPKEGNNFKHGDKGTKLYGVWKSMRERCYTQTCSSYKHYGARGISVCKEWDDYKVFKEWAINNGYRDDLTIDRKNVNGNYEPSNCRWITWKEQMDNRRTSRFITINGVTQTLQQWSEQVGLNGSTIAARIRRGWSEEDAVFKPLKATQRLGDPK